MKKRVLLLAAGVFLLASCADGDVVGPTPGRPTFDGDRALAHVHTQVGFGPRVTGRPGHAAQLDWMLTRLDSLAPDLAVDSFTHMTAGGDSIGLVNVVARFLPEARRRMVVLAHWDTRPTADADPDPSRRLEPIPGANDGASGVAVLMELARLMAEAPPPLGVDLLFVDGEDYGPGSDDMFLGARHYAGQLPSREESEAGEGRARPIYGLLLDMVGDADPRFPVEAHSAEFAPIVVQKVWRAAERLGYRDLFPSGVGQRIYDDHIPLIEAGLPTANLIDFKYGPNNGYWHTHEDVPEHVSAETLFHVGEVVSELIYSGG